MTDHPTIDAAEEYDRTMRTALHQGPTGLLASRAFWLGGLLSVWVWCLLGWGASRIL